MKLLQRWQFSSQGEKSLEAECNTCDQFGFDGICAKALDGTMWMRVVDHNGDALSSYDDVTRAAEYCHARGLQFYVWFNPLQSDWQTQAAMAAECMNRCDGGAFDTEPYAGFWGAYAPVGLADSYMQSVVGQLSDANKPRIWQPDPRPGHLVEVRQEEWSKYMTHYAPQVYVSDFYFNPSAQLMNALLFDMQQVAQQFGLISCPTLPGLASPDLLPADTISACDGYVVWRIGSTPPATLSYLGGLQMAGTPTPTPDPTPDPTPTPEPAPDQSADDKIASLRTFINDIADRVVNDRLAKVLDLLDALRAEVVSISEEAERERTEVNGPRNPPDTMGEAHRVPLFRLEHPGTSILEGANKHP